MGAAACQPTIGLTDNLAPPSPGPPDRRLSKAKARVLRLLRRLWRTWRQPRRPWLRRVFVAALLSAGLVTSLFFVPAQWVGRVLPWDSVVDDDAVAFRPGHAVTTSGRMSVDGLTVFEPEGEILLTTVAIDDSVTVIEWIESSFEPSIELRTRESVYGTRSNSEQRERNRQLMELSKDSAVIAALEYLGVNAVDVAGVAFGETVVGAPAHGLLRSDEVIVAIDSEPVTTLGSLLELLQVRPPGTPAMITVEHFETGELRDVELTLGVHPEGRAGGFIGISEVYEHVHFHPLPFEIGISSGSVGGPSAGLAFSLAIIDLLTPGELTGGRRVAVTGSIGIDGTVGGVGGVAQKVATAADAGAELFLVPVESQIPTPDYDMSVVAVRSLNDALEALGEVGGDVTNLALPQVDSAVTEQGV